MNSNVSKQLLDAARVIALTPAIRIFLEQYDPQALKQLRAAIDAATMNAGQVRRRERVKWLKEQIPLQQAWIISCGRDLSGYRAHYGDPDMEQCFGDGGTAIYKADTDELARLEAELRKEEASA